MSTQEADKEKNLNKDQQQEKQPPVYETLKVEYGEYQTTLTDKFRKRKAFKDLEWDKVTAFISGNIGRVYAKKGRKVKEGGRLLVLEAMKMKNLITSPIDAKVKKVYVKKGDVVRKGQLLVELEELD